MFRALFAALLLIHGLIHLLGFVSQWHLATVRQMSDRTLIPLSEITSKLLGLGWLLGCIGFVLAAPAYWYRRESWLILTAITLILSQILMVIYWPDARAGTMANVIIALVLLVTWASRRFDRMADAEARFLLNQPYTTPSEPITHPMLASLPAPVQAWLLASGAVGHARVHSGRLRQRGLMRIQPGGPWMPTRAVQYFRIDQPGFVWKADVRMFRFVPLAGRDKYMEGKGNMLIKVGSLIPVVNAADSKTDQGTLLRFLAELCWFPSAALSPYLTWQPIDDAHAQVIMTHKGVTASARFGFDQQHRLTTVTANRYYGSGAAAQLETWYVTVRDWTTRHGIVIPSKGDVGWTLPAGDFTYYQWEITDIDYNPATLYPSQMQPAQP